MKVSELWTVLRYKIGWAVIILLTAIPTLRVLTVMSSYAFKEGYSLLTLLGGCGGCRWFNAVCTQPHLGCTFACHGRLLRRAQSNVYRSSPERWNCPHTTEFSSAAVGVSIPDQDHASSLQYRSQIFVAPSN